MTANEKLSSELLIVRNVNENLQNRTITLEKQQSNSEQYNRRNNVGISGISNEVVNQNLEQIVIGICKDSEIDVNPLDIKGCHRIPLGRNATNTTKKVIMNIISSRLSEAMLQRKKDMNQKRGVC